MIPKILKWYPVFMKKKAPFPVENFSPQSLMQFDFEGENAIKNIHHFQCTFMYFFADLFMTPKLTNGP